MLLKLVNRTQIEQVIPVYAILTLSAGETAESHQHTHIVEVPNFMHAQVRNVEVVD